MKAKLFRGVPFARSGWQEYIASELGRGGGEVIQVWRDPEEVKRSAQSFSGVPVTEDHPPQMVTGDNLERYAVGLVTDPYFDAASQQVKADLIVWDGAAIQSIAKGTRELSGGYGADYVTNSRGLSQVNIEGNHVALVPRGRSGSAQRIGG